MYHLATTEDNTMMELQMWPALENGTAAQEHKYIE